MEPKLPAPSSSGLEQAPSYDRRPELAPLPPTPEQGIGQRVEQLEQRSEATSASSETPVLPPPVVAATVPLPVDETTAVQPATDDMPLVANDDDLIEKEWVDKAKKIIVQTKDDPYRREQEVGKLQADYLRKRYGKELGAPS